MKQTGITGFICFFLIFQAFHKPALSQDVSSSGSGGIHYGLHLGITGSIFSDEQPHRAIQHDYTGGVSGMFSFSENMSLEAELNYFEHGGRMLKITSYDQLSTSDAFDYKIEDQRISVRSLELPLMAVYSLDLGSSKMNISAGPGMEWIMHAGIRSQVTARYPSDPSVFTTFYSEENITKNMPRFIYNAVTGIGMEFPFLGETSMTLDLRYRYSINRVYKGFSYLGIASTGANLRQHSVSLYLGINF